MASQELLDELEVLKSIFYEEFLDLTNAPANHYGIILRPDDDAYDGFSAREGQYAREHWIFFMRVECPEDYPKSGLPVFHVSLEPFPETPETIQSAIQAAMYSFQHGSELNTDNLIVEVLEKVANEKSAEMLRAQDAENRTVVVYDIIMMLKEQLAAMLRERLSKVRRREADAQNEAILSDRRKFSGTAVTPASFMKWKSAFENEKKAAKALEREKAHKDGTLKPDKPTGRQLFEADRSMMSSDCKFINDDDEVIDESLFAGVVEGLEDDSDAEPAKDDDESVMQVAELIMKQGIN